MARRKRSWEKMEFNRTVTDGKGKAVTSGSGKAVTSRGRPTKKKAAAKAAPAKRTSVKRSTPKKKQYSGRGSVGMPKKTRKVGDGGVNRAERRNPIRGTGMKDLQRGPSKRNRGKGKAAPYKTLQRGPSRRRSNGGKFNQMSTVGGAIHRFKRGQGGANPTNIRNIKRSYIRRRNSRK